MYIISIYDYQYIRTELAHNNSAKRRTYTAIKLDTNITNCITKHCCILRTINSVGKHYIPLWLHKQMVQRHVHTRYTPCANTVWSLQPQENDTSKQTWAHWSAHSPGMLTFRRECTFYKPIHSDLKLKDKWLSQTTTMPQTHHRHERWRHKHHIMIVTYSMQSTYVHTECSIGWP